MVLRCAVPSLFKCDGGEDGHCTGRSEGLLWETRLAETGLPRLSTGRSENVRVTAEQLGHLLKMAGAGCLRLCNQMPALAESLAKFAGLFLRETAHAEGDGCTNIAQCLKRP